MPQYGRSFLPRESKSHDKFFAAGLGMCCPAIMIFEKMLTSDS